MTEPDYTNLVDEPPMEEPVAILPATVAFATGAVVMLHDWDLSAFGPDSAIEWLLYGRIDRDADGPEAGAARITTVVLPDRDTLHGVDVDVEVTSYGSGLPVMKLRWTEHR